jgi:dipeptidase E
VRLLLTSNGLRNDLLVAALSELLGKPFAESAVAVIPTASLAVPGDHGWLLEDLSRLYALGWRELGIVALYGLPHDSVVDRLRSADVIYAEGGNPVHLANGIIVNDLADDIRQLLEDRVYVGVSAGSNPLVRCGHDVA